MTTQDTFTTLLKPPAVVDATLSKPTETLSVMHVAAPGVVGGLERVVHALAAGQHERGHDVTVVAVVDAGARDNAFVTAAASSGVEVVPLELSARAYLRERRAVSELCRRKRPDIVHTHGYRPDVIDAGVARSLGIATVTTVHGTTGGDWRNRWYERLQRRAFRRFDAVVAVSTPLADSLAASGVARDRLHIVPNAYRSSGAILDRAAARRALSLSDEDYAIGWVGRLGCEKGPDLLLSAAARLPEWFPAVRVCMLGDGQERATLEEHARSLGLAPRVTWYGMVRDAGRLLRAFDVFVLSSRTEGTPIVLLEAMAAGVPIVAAAVGGVPYVVTPGEALLVPKDDPAAIAVAICDVHDDPASARRRAAAASTTLARQFDHRSWIAQYDAIYRHVQRARALLT